MKSIKLNILEISTNQLLEVEFEVCDVAKTMVQTCYAFPEDYPTVDVDVAGKTIKAWFVGYKATGNRVFIFKNGTCITDEKKRIRDISSIIWRLRLERD